MHVYLQVASGDLTHGKDWHQHAGSPSVGGCGWTSVWGEADQRGSMASTAAAGGGGGWQVVRGCLHDNSASLPKCNFW